MSPQISPRTGSTSGIARPFLGAARYSEAARASGSETHQPIRALTMLGETDATAPSFLVRTELQDQNELADFIANEVRERLRSNGNVRRIVCRSTYLDFDVAVYVRTWSVEEVRKINSQLSEVYRSLAFRFPDVGLETHVRTLDTSTGDLADSGPGVRVVYDAE